MKPRFRKFRQKWGVYYVLDTETGRPKASIPAILTRLTDKSMP